MIDIDKQLEKAFSLCEQGHIYLPGPYYRAHLFEVPEREGRAYRCSEAFDGWQAKFMELGIELSFKWAIFRGDKELHYFFMVREEVTREVG